MGNCQAVDAAALVIQHPSGSIERMYWPISASEVMKMNPGHYVSLIIPLPTSGEQNTDKRTVRFTRVKLLRPSETLALGRAYRLVTSQEVMKVLRAKKYSKMKKNQSDSGDKSQIDQERKSSNCEEETEKPELAKKGQVKNSVQLANNYPWEATRHERHQQIPGPTNFPAARSKSWRPSLQSISEGGS